MKTLGQVLNEIDLDRKRSRMERIQSITPYLQQAYSTLKQKEMLDEQRAYQQKIIDEQRAYDENKYQQRRTDQFEDYKKQTDYSQEKQKDMLTYRSNLEEKESKGSVVQSESSGLNFFDSIKKPADYLKYVDKKVESETYTKRDGSEGGANYVYIRKNGKITKIPVQRSANGVYTWNNGNPIDLSKTLDLEEINKANSMGDIDDIDIHYNYDDARVVLPKKAKNNAPVNKTKNNTPTNKNEAMKANRSKANNDQIKTPPVKNNVPANNGTKGNIDTSKIDPVKNKDGSFSTVRSISINEDGKEILIPTVINGKVVSDKMAIDHYHKTNQHLGKFDTVEEANAYAKKLHEEEETRINKKQNAGQKKNKNNEVAISEYFKKYARK